MKTTRKEIYRIYGKENVILLGYCEIRYIQNYLTKVGHTERVEGWAANVFELPAPYNNIAICTGYAPFGTKNENARTVCERWEKLYYNYDFSQRERMIKRFARELSKTIITMRTFFAQVETRYRAIKDCPFTPAHVVKVLGGYMCFESDNDYRVWRNQK